MAKIRVGKDPTPSELAAANALAKRIAIQKHLASGENTNVGNTIPKFYNEAGTDITGKPTTSSLHPLTITDINAIPGYVKELQWDANRGQPYYIDEKTDDMKYVHPNIFYSARFNPDRGKPPSLLSYAKR